MRRAGAGARVVEVFFSAGYRTSLRLLPKRFRRDYGPQMRLVVEERAAEARNGGASGISRCWIGEIVDVLRTAARLRYDQWRSQDRFRLAIPNDEGSPLVERLLYEIRLTARNLLRHPGFCTVVLVTLAIAIGATTTIFSLVHAVLIEPLPFPEPERLVLVWETDRLTGTQREPASVPDFRDFEERNTVLDGLAAFFVRQGNLNARDQRPEQVTVAFGSHDLLEVLGIAPVVGRDIDPAEDEAGGPAVALVSYGFWNGRLNRDPEILGRRLALDETPYQVIGVLPEGLSFPDPAIDLFVPLQPSPDSLRATHGIQLVGRLRPGVGIAAAQEEFTAIAADLEATYPENRARGVFIESLADVMRGEVRPALLLLMGAVATVLLIACGNVAGLMLARGASRRQEIAVCAALGAGTGQIARRFLIEALLLTGAGTAAGLLLAVGALEVLAGLLPAELLARFPVEMNLPVLLFSVGISLVIGIVFGLLPLRPLLALDLQESLQSARGSFGALRMGARRLLVVGQVGLAMVLLAGSALLLNSLRELQSVNPGFRADQTLRATFRLPTSRYPRDFAVFPRWQEVHDFNHRLLDSVEALPGVRAAALSITHPMASGWTNSFVIVGREAEFSDQGELKTRIISEDYLRTVGIAVVEGRGFESSDGTDSTPVLLVNESAVRRYFPEGRVLGQQIRFWGASREIVGIVANVRMHGLREETPPAMYVPLWQAPPTAAETLLIWSSVDPMSLAGPVREAVWALDPQLAVYDVTTMVATLSSSLAREHLTASLLIAFGLTALLLAAVGLHGLLSYLVVLQRHEVGVRMALGASRRNVITAVLAQGGRLAVAGILLGLVAALLLGRLLSALLFGVAPSDPPSIAAAALVLGVAVLASALLPALRAGKVDPTVSLRSG